MTWQSPPSRSIEHGGALRDRAGLHARTAGDPCTRFWRLAHEAIEAGLLTREEARLVARVGHRKQPYWLRHLHDLEALIARRTDERRGRTEEGAHA